MEKKTPHKWCTLFRHRQNYTRKPREYRPMDRKQWPAGIRPTSNGQGFRLKIYQKGRCVHSETITCDIHKASNLKSAIVRREDLSVRLRLGLSLNESAIEPEDASSPYFRDAAQDFLDLSDELKDSVRAQYMNSINCYWLQPFGAKRCHEITENDIRRILSGPDNNLGWKGKRNALTPLRGILKTAGIDPNPAMAVQPKKGQKKRVVRYTPIERDAILNQLEGPAQAYFAIAFGCGLRSPSEIIALTWDRWDGETLFVDRGVVRGQLEESTKTHHSRRVFVPQWVRPYINNLASRFKGSWMFPAQHGGHLHDAETIYKKWKEAHKATKIPYRTPYTCRHTRAAELLSSGSSEYAKFAKQLGHSLEMFLNNYSEVIEEYSASDNSIFEGLTPSKSLTDRQKSDKTR